jgi:hypothetical protein
MLTRASFAGREEEGTTFRFLRLRRGEGEGKALRGEGEVGGRGTDGWVKGEREEAEEGVVLVVSMMAVVVVDVVPEEEEENEENLASNLSVRIPSRM